MYTVMICDDEKIQREGLAHHVQWAEYGFEAPMLCSSAWEALQVIRERHVDLLLTDVRMPGKDGLELAEECRALQADLYTVIISGYAEFDYARRAMQNGAREYLLKPVKPEDVHKALKTFLQWKNTGDRNGVTLDQNAEQVMRLLEEHVMEGITIAELADAVHMNASYLCTLFKRVYGVTIADQMNILQRDRACRLLATSDLSMGEISDQSGGRSASGFAQWFRKLVGMTPGEYRRLVRDQDPKRHGNRE